MGADGACAGGGLGAPWVGWGFMFGHVSLTLIVAHAWILDLDILIYDMSMHILSADAY